MDQIVRRSFLRATAGAAAYWVSPAAASEQKDDPQESADIVAVTERRPSSFGLPGEQGNLTPHIVHRAIERGVQYLKSKQLIDGTWPNRTRYDVGLTPLCTLALLNSECGLSDSSVAKAMAYLRQYIPRSTYTASLQTMVFCAADPKKDVALIERNVKWLESRQHQNGEFRGMWAIRSEGSTDHTDNSMSHFALLALNEAERVGVSANPRTWTIAHQHWQSTQNDDGSWGWGPTYPGSGSMTCAGIAALFIASGALNPPDSEVHGDQIIGCKTQFKEPLLEKAIGWLERHFSVYRNPGTEFWKSYYLYSLERAGRMAAWRFIGGHDWYREGAKMLVETQQLSGSWPSDLEYEDVADQKVSTCFSLMFLSKGRWPLVVAHLKRLPTDDWNRHRGALTNLIGHLDQAWERNLTHQIVDLNQATVEELLESPVLFLNGRDLPQWTHDEKKKLRMYVDRGGFIFAECCCSGQGFDSGFRAAMKDVFPEPETKLRPLPLDHPVWFAEKPIDPDFLPPLWGIDVSCRTGVIYSPTDLSCYWELDRIGRQVTGSTILQERIRTARNVGLNVLTYATGREVAFKNPSFPAASTQLASHAPFERGKFYIANVLHPGGCQAAPAALHKLLRRASEEHRIEVNIEPHEVRLTDPELFHYLLLLFHGRAGFELTRVERQQLRVYLERGGTVIADAVCSNADFTKSFRREIKEILPDRLLQEIPPNDPLCTPAYGGADITTVSRRKPKSLLRDTSAPSETIKTPPALEAVRLDGRYAVIFSQYDISCALETEPIGCEGYIRQDAANIAMNVLFYALNQ